MIINANQGSGGGNLQPTVTVTPSTSTQSIKPDPPYNGLSEVIVNPAPLEVATVKSSTAAQPPITPTAPNIGFSSITVEPNLLQTKAVTLPTSQPIRPDSGYYGLAGVNVSAPLYQYPAVTPTQSVQTLNVPNGYYGLDEVKVLANMGDAFGFMGYDFQFTFSASRFQITGLPSTASTLVGFSYFDVNSSKSIQAMWFQPYVSSPSWNGPELYVIHSLNNYELLYVHDIQCSGGELSFNLSNWIEIPEDLSVSNTYIVAVK